MNHLRFLLALGAACCFADATAQQNLQFSTAPFSLQLRQPATDSLPPIRFALGLFSNAHKVSGFQWGWMGNVARTSLRGLQWGLLTNVTDTLRGVQLSAISNISLKPMRGVQWSGVSNISMGVERGLQFSGLTNVSSGTVKGAQVGAYNYADSLKGWQVGLINVSRHTEGSRQIGLVNYVHDGNGRHWGLVNLTPQTRMDVLLFAGNTSKFNAALRFRNDRSYTQWGVGTHYMGLDKRFSGALSYAIGRYVWLTKPYTHNRAGGLMLSGDVSYSHIETFEAHTSHAAGRLYSLQAHVNLDYRLSNRVGAFLSGGYGFTRYYAHNRRYKDEPVARAGLSISLIRPAGGMAAEGSENTRPEAPYWLKRTGQVGAGETTLLGGEAAGEPHPWRAAAYVAGINVGVHSFDRWVLNEEFAQVNLHTIAHNVKYGFVWDNDKFSTNLFAHPYHGNLYFNAARSHGLSFRQSVPYAFMGSMMWEFMGEREPAAINDLLATTFGGICLGEITHRAAKLLRAGQRRGGVGFARRLAATLIDPVGAFVRTVEPDSRRSADADGADKQTTVPIDFSLAVGNRYLADNGSLFRGEHNPFVHLFMEYGQVFAEQSRQPYDFFSGELHIGLSANQPFIHGVHVLGQLWASPVYEHNSLKVRWGLYQHFNFYDSAPVKDGSDETPYRISEAAAAGPGLIFSFPAVGALSKLEQRTFLSAIVLGGSKSDYYNVIDRDYNMGSGFSMKSKTHLEFRRFGRFVIHADYYRIFTWKGYHGKDLAHIDPLYVNAQGDKGNAQLMVVNPLWEFDLKGRWSVLVSGAFYWRNTHYKYHPDRSSHTFETRVGMVWHR